MAINTRIDATTPGKEIVVGQVNLPENIQYFASEDGFPHRSNQMNDMADEMNITADEVNDNAVIATTKANEASVSALASSQSALQAQGSANNKGAWADLTGALTIPASVNHNGSIWSLNVDLADISTSEPTGANSDWTLITSAHVSNLNSLGTVVIPDNTNGLLLQPVVFERLIVGNNSTIKLI